MTDEEKNEICDKCEMKIWFAKIWDQHIDWRDCFIICDKIQEK